MQIRSRLTADGFHLSFEIFPPKQFTSMENVRKAALDIAALNPSFVSVTYGAGGGTSAFTLDLAREIQEKTGVPSVAHLTCVNSSREEVTLQIRRMQEQGIENVMALRGDILAGHEAGPWAYTHASDLITQLKSAGDFCIGGACYPEVHPDSACQADDLRHLRTKVDAGCDFLTTQMFFDNATYYAFLCRLREQGITVPVLPGIMPITSRRQIERALSLSRAFLPRRFLALLDQFGSSDRAMTQAGIAYATDQIIDLFANGIHTVHVYTMNRTDVAQALCRNLSDILTP